MRTSGFASPRPEGIPAALKLAKGSGRTVVTRATAAVTHAVVGTVCGHREYLMCSERDLAAALLEDPSLAGLAWTAIGDRLVASRYTPATVVTPENVDAVAAAFLASLVAMAPGN